MSWVSEVKWDIPCPQPSPEDEDNPGDALMEALMALKKGDACVMGCGGDNGYTTGWIMHDTGFPQAFDIAEMIVAAGEKLDFPIDRVVHVRLFDPASPVADA